MAELCEICAIINGPDEAVAERVRTALAAISSDEMHNAKGIAYRVDGAWYDSNDVRYHLLAHHNRRGAVIHKDHAR